MTEPTWKDPLLREWQRQCPGIAGHVFTDCDSSPDATPAQVLADALGYNDGFAGKSIMVLVNLIDAELARGREAVEVLREVEWSGSLDGDSCCPVCENWKHDARREGHAHDCRLARLLTAPKP